MKVSFALLSFTLFFQSCTGMMYRSHEEKMAEETPFWTPGKDFPVMNGDTGKVGHSYNELLSRTPATYKGAQIQQEQLITLQELEHLQSKMTEEEVEDFKREEHLFETPEQKLYFLRLNKSEQANYLVLLREGQGPQLAQSIRDKKAKGLDQDSDKIGQDHWSFLRPKIEEISTGMEKDQVIQRWGRPKQVAIAGDPVHENERWSFRHGSTNRVVYFERGVVVGWEQF